MPGLALFLAVSAAATLILGLAAFLTGVDKKSAADLIAGLVLFGLAFLYGRAFVSGSSDANSPTRLRTLARMSIASFVLVPALMGWRYPEPAFVVAVILSAIFGVPLLFAAKGVESAFRPPDPVPAGSIDGAAASVRKQRGVPWLLPVVPVIVLMIFLNPGFRTDTVGGKWVIVWVRGLPEAGGGPWPMLHRRRLISTRRVDELVREYNYIGDDCVVYITYYSTRIGLRAACGDHPPIVLSGTGSGIDWRSPHPEFRTDPIQVGESTFVSVAEVKKRAMAAR